MKIDAFSSDLHFGHENIITFCSRPFYSTNHMTEELIKRHNSVVGKDDTIVYVGDLFFVNKDLASGIMEDLNGRKILVRGNHDKFSSEEFLELGFEMIVDSLMLEIEGVNVKVCHYPYSDINNAEWYDKYKNKRPVRADNEILIHGHTHSKEKYSVTNSSIHVGVDAWGYKPVTFEKVTQIVQEIKKFTAGNNTNEF